MGPKTKIFIEGNKALNVSSFDLSQKTSNSKKENQNRIKNGRFMPIKSSRAKSAVGLFWAENWIFWSHFLQISTSISGFFFKVSIAHGGIYNQTSLIWMFTEI